MTPKRTILSPIILNRALRKTNLDEYAIRRMVEEGDLSATFEHAPLKDRIRLTLLENGSESADKHHYDGALPATDLAAASAWMTEISIVVAATNVIFDSDSEPPRINVSGGSISFTIGGGLFASGVGMIVAYCEGLLTKPEVGVVAGAALASVGLIELAIDWKKKVVEVRKMEEEVRKLHFERDPHARRQSRRIQDLEIQKRELDLEIARRKKWEEVDGGPVTAYSALVPPAVIRSEAERWGLTEPFALHLLNRTLPTYLALSPFFSHISADGAAHELRRGKRPPRR